MLEVSMNAAQWASIADYMSNVETEDGDRVIFVGHAGGNVEMQVVDSTGVVVDSLELDTKGEA